MIHQTSGKEVVHPADNATRRDAVLRSRAISDEMISFPDGQRYVEFERHDWEAFTAGHSNPETWHKGLVSQSGGYVVNRWDIAGQQLPSYIRFDQKVTSRSCERPGHPERCRRAGGRSNHRVRQRRTRYIYPGQAILGESPAKQIDVHPALRKRLLAGGAPIYYCIEGCLKADAVASTGRLAVSVPSVTLWELSDEDLEPWLPILKAAPVVYMIPDSDYNPKRWGYGTGEPPIFVNGGEVRYFTDSAVAFYRDLGVRAVFMVPPYLSIADAHLHGFAAEERWKIGIDDHLRIGGNFGRWDFDTNPRGLHIFEYKRPPYVWLPELKRQRKDRAIKRDRAFLTWLLGRSGTVGLYRPADAKRALGWSEDKLLRAKNSCVKRGVLRIWNGKAERLGEGYVNRPHLYRYEIGPDLEAVA